MPPLGNLEPKLADADTDAPPDTGRPLNVMTHFKKGDDNLHLGLRIKLPAKWDSRSVKEAIVDPFVTAYDNKFPAAPASAFQPFTQVKVLIWAGPTYAAADYYREKDRDGVDDIEQAEKPIYGLLAVDEPVSVLRKRAHNSLKPTIELELVAAESTAIVLRSVPTTALLKPGEQLIAMLTDKEAEPEDMHALVDAAIAGGELAYLGLTTARDRDGKNPLHLAVTRGDSTLCRKLLRRREDVHAMDSNRNTALHSACLAGRQLIVADLCELGAHLHEKNRDLMTPLQLAVVDEAQGNGEIVRMLVERGCDIDAKCWDVTPLMAAAAGGHYWALEVLLELGADPMIQNGYYFMAMDYARDQDTAELLHDFMRGFLLPDEGLLKRQAESRTRRKQYGSIPGISPEMDDKGPRLYQSNRVLPLPAAFEALQLPSEWVEGFKASGEHFAEIRRAWRQVVLNHHPDRLSKELSNEEQAKHTAIFTKAMDAFEAIDTFYARHHAPPTPQLADEWAAAPTGTASGGGSMEAPPAAAPATPPAAASAVNVSQGEEAKDGAGSRDATARAARPLLFKRRVRIKGLQAKPEYNGRVGLAKLFDRTAQRYGVELEGDQAGTLKVKEANLELVDDHIEIA